MRTAAMVLGITGGVFGILSGFLAMFIGGVGTAFGLDQSGMVFVLGMAAIVISVIGIIGGALAGRNPLAAAVLIGFAGVTGFLAISLFWILAGLMLLPGALLAWLSWLQSRGSTGDPVDSIDAERIAGDHQVN
jgi:hypothetical protein